jgi:quinol monooxygenase YgiN
MTALVIAEHDHGTLKGATLNTITAAHQAGGDVHVLIPGREAEAEVRLLQVVAYVRKAEPGAIYRLHRSSSEPTSFVFYETYASQAALDQHRKVTIAGYMKEYGPPAEGLWARTPTVEMFRELAR